MWGASYTRLTFACVKKKDVVHYRGDPDTLSLPLSLTHPSCFALNLPTDLERLLQSSFLLYISRYLSLTIR